MPVTRTTTLDQVLQEAEVDSMGPLAPISAQLTRPCSRMVSQSLASGPPRSAGSDWHRATRCRCCDLAAMASLIVSGAQVRSRRPRPDSTVITLSMPVCSPYLSLAVSSAWRTQLDNECGKAPAQRVRRLRYPAPACRQRAFLHVR